MPRLERWIVASKLVPVFDNKTLRQIVSLGGMIGGGWSLVHQHINVNAENKEKIEGLLRSQGFKVSGISDGYMPHPEVGRMAHQLHDIQDGGE